MKKIFKYISSLRKDIGFVLICSIVIVILIDFWLIDIPEVFHGGYKLGQLLHHLCLAFISAFIFYFLVVHVKAQKDKSNLNIYIRMKVNGLIGDAKGLVKEMAMSINEDLTIDIPSKEKMLTIYNKIDPHAKAPMLLSNHINADWIEYIFYKKVRSIETIDKLRTLMPFLDSILISIISDLEDCSHFKMLRFYRNSSSIENTDITFLKSTFDEYLELIKKLESYSNSKLNS